MIEYIIRKTKEREGRMSTGKAYTLIAVWSMAFALVAGLAVRAYMQHKLNTHQIIDARNDMQSNIYLLEAELKWEKHRGLQTGWIESQEEYIKRQKAHLEIVYEWAEEYLDAGFWEKVFYATGIFDNVSYVNTSISLELQKTVVALSNRMDDCINDYPLSSKVER